MAAYYSCASASDTSDAASSTSTDTAKVASGSVIDPSAKTAMTYERLYDMFMANYGTLDNYLRCYGGSVSPIENENGVSDIGKLEIQLSRPVQYPTELLAEFDFMYQEDVPHLVPTAEELKMLE